MTKPNLFIVGAPRCGTTYLHNVLAQHPDVFMSKEKEPSYFSQDLGAQHKAFQGGKAGSTRTLDQYLDLFSGATGQPVVGESSVVYLFSDVAAQAIHDFNPKARIVCMVRDPIELLRSLYAKLIITGDEDCPSFSEALDREPERRQGRALPRNLRVPFLVYYSDFAQLAPRIRRYIGIFGAERVKVVVLDDLEQDPDRIYGEVLDYLGVKRLPLPESGIVNSNRLPRSSVLHRLLLKCYSNGRFRYGARLGSLVRRLNSRPVRRDPLDPALRVKLTSRYRPCVEDLSELLGRDLVRLWQY